MPLTADVSANSAIASAVTNLTNLQGIPNALNSFKKQVFTFNLTGKGGPRSGKDANAFNFYGPAIQKYLASNQDQLMAGIVNDIGVQLQSAGANNANISSYFTSYAKSHYQGCIDYLSTWTGKDLDRATSSTSSSQPITTSAAALTTLITTAAVTSATPTLSCYHMADPDNSCAAIADSRGWCECGDSDSSYAIMTGTAVQPCDWTTTPPTTTFNCEATPTSTCNVPDGCTNAVAPPGCAALCT